MLRACCEHAWSSAPGPVIPPLFSSIYSTKHRENKRAPRRSNQPTSMLGSQASSLIRPAGQLAERDAVRTLSAERFLLEGFGNPDGVGENGQGAVEGHRRLSKQSRNPSNLIRMPEKRGRRPDVQICLLSGRSPAVRYRVLGSVAGGIAHVHVPVRRWDSPASHRPPDCVSSSGTAYICFFWTSNLPDRMRRERPMRLNPSNQSGKLQTQITNPKNSTMHMNQP
jgi:hypothetical protein